MYTVGQCDHFRFTVACKLQCFQRSHGVAREADADNHILFIDPDQLFKYFTGAVRMNTDYVFADQI